jgi:uncharacterized protein (DUF58 family)
MVREFTREDERKLRIVFDNPAPGQVKDEEYESSVRLTASLVWHFADGATDLTFAAPGYSGSQEALSFLKYLALVEPIGRSWNLDAFASGDAYNLLITARPRGSIPTELWTSSYIIFLGNNHA